MNSIRFSDNYNFHLERIEDHILESTKSIDAVSKFLDEHDRALSFVFQNPNAAAVSETTGDRSWIFADGRYRLFYISGIEDSKHVIFLTHIIDNRELNKEIYPENQLPTYWESE